MNEIATLERTGPSERMFKRFVNDLDTDEELDTDQEEKWQNEKKQKPKSRARRLREREQEESEEEEESSDEEITPDMIEYLKQRLAEMSPEEKEIDKIMTKFEKGHDFDPNSNLKGKFMEFNESEVALGESMS